MRIWRGWIVFAALVIGLAASRPVYAGSKTVELEINGLVALADLVVPDGGSIQQRVVLITHGTLAHKDMELVEALQTALAERGIASLAHSLTYGLNARKGMYDCAVPHIHTHKDAVNEIGAWVAWLKKQGAGPVILLGHSRGGNHAAWFGAEHPDGKVTQMVLMAPATAGPEGRTASRYRNRFKAEIGPIVKKAEELVASGRSSEMMRLPGFIYCPDTMARASSVVSYYGKDMRRDTPSLLPKVKVPVLVIAASRDTVVPDVVERVRPLADGKKIQLKVIDGAGHMFLDFYVEDAADLIAEFIAK